MTPGGAKQQEGEIRYIFAYPSRATNRRLFERRQPGASKFTQRQSQMCGCAGTWIERGTKALARWLPKRRGWRFSLPMV